SSTRRTTRRSSACARADGWPSRGTPCAWRAARPRGSSKRGCRRSRSAPAPRSTPCSRAREGARMSYEIRRGPFLLSTDRSRLNVTVIQRFLSDSYWAPGVPESVVRRSIEGSLCFGVYEEERQVAFGRVVTDYATFAWIADVFVLGPWRGRGLAQW